MRNVWARHPAWPDRVGKRGRRLLFDPAAVDAVIAEHIERPDPELEPRSLYTAKDIEALTGITTGTIRAKGALA